MTKKHFLLLNILLLFSSCHAQELPKQPDSRKEVQPIGDTVTALDQRIMTIYQDSRNNRWFGSNGKGVFKFDGKNLIQFTIEDGLCANAIWGIQEDKLGNIYFDTQDGVSKFDGKAFTTLPLDTSADNKWELHPDDLWFKGNWNENGAWRYDGKTLYKLKLPKSNLEEEYFKMFPGLSHSPYGIYTLYKDQEGSIWFGTATFGACRYNGKSLRWLYENQLTETPEGGSFGIRSVIEDRKGKFWFCNTRYRYDMYPDGLNDADPLLINYKREKGITTLKTASGQDLVYFMSVVEDKNGDLWMLTYNQGVWRYDGNKVTHYPVKDGDFTIKLFSIYQDNQGVLWLGTHDDGAYRFNGKTFVKFTL